jgi:outer membrane protein assembly factor BamB
MRILRRGVGIAAAVLLVAATVSGAPAEADHGHGGHDNGPDRIDLPDGWQPEGITTDGRHLFGGSLADGAIFEADPRSGDVDVLAEGAPHRVAAGIDYDKRRDLLWVAGADTGEVRAQDADTGAVLATYPVPDGDSRFLNDVAVTRHAVYVTDSFGSDLVVIPLSDHHGKRHGHGDDGLPPASAVQLLPLTGDFVAQDGFNLNGIVRSGKRLIAVQTNTGTLFVIDPRSGETGSVDLGGETVVNGDGLEEGHGRLYVVRNADNLIAVVHLRHHRTRGEVEDEITSDGFDTPTTAALVRHSLYAVNARFGETPTPDTEYWITRVDAD